MARLYWVRSSVRIRFAGFNDPDSMVGEFEMRAGQFVFRHMAFGAIPLTDFADSRRRLMAGETLGVVKGLIAPHLLVRVVAGRAGDAAVFEVVAPAAEYSIRLEADIAHPLRRHQHHLSPRAMTRAAKFRLAVSVESARIENSLVREVARLHRGDVIGARPVAALAAYPRRQFVRTQPPFDDRSRGVATETISGVGAVQQMSCGLGQ